MASGSASEDGWSDEETRLRGELCRVGELCYRRGLIAGADGNLSARLSDGTLLITRAGALKGLLGPEEIARIDLAGRGIGPGPRPSTEAGIHLVAYRERPDVAAVVHAHPPHAVALTLAGIDLEAPVIPELVAALGGIPTAPFATPGTDELPASIRALVRRADAVLLKSHGARTVGRDPLEAFARMDMVEHAARILWLAHALGRGVDELPAAAVARLRRAGPGAQGHAADPQGM